MIPRHRPPFGPAALLTAGVRSMLRRSTVEGLERAYEARLGVQNAVWIPSARYGIARSIQIALSANADVLCPVFNCGAVFHAAQETQRDVTFIDTAPQSFLMDLQAIPSTTGAAVILSEMFGHRFDQLELRNSPVAAAAIRVFDLAMGIPTASDMSRMQEDDVTVASFGIGKSLYAGWGGMAFTNSNSMADQLRERRNAEVSAMNLRQQMLACAQMAARTIAHEPVVYKYLRTRPDTANSNSPNLPDSFSPESREWHRPWNQLHLQLALQNLAAVDGTIQTRTSLANVYREELSDLVGAQSSANETDYALSHFSIRVPADVRDKIRQTLWDKGFDVGTLFPFPAHLANADEFPEAARAAAEVLNLPLSCQLTIHDVRSIASIVRSFFEARLSHPLAA